MSTQRSALFSTATTVAPYTRICVTRGPTAPLVVNTMQGNPALAAYAAAAAPALPVELETIALAPILFATETAMQARRSLNDQVGLRVSSLAQSCTSASR